jgi:hypothetical protein
MTAKLMKVSTAARVTGMILVMTIAPDSAGAGTADHSALSARAMY